MKVETKFGTQQGTQDSWVGKGEVITDGNDAHVVKRGSRIGTDDVPAKTEGREDSAVLGNLPWIRLSQQLGHPITYAQATRSAAEKIETYDKLFSKKRSDDIETRRGTGSVTKTTETLREKARSRAIGQELGFIQQAQQDQATERPIHEMAKNYNKGKNLPCHAWGTDAWGNIITSGLGTLAGVGQYINARNQKLNSPDVYAPNQYERQGLTTLAGLRDNPYNQLRAMQDVEARNRFAMSQSGGLTGSQKYLANVSSGIGLQRNYADILYRSNQLNNQYKAAWANAAINAGQADAQRRQAANQYRDEAYARSHAARQQQMQMGIQNTLGAIQQYYANEFKRNQFDRTMALYWAEHEAKYGGKNTDMVIPDSTKAAINNMGIRAAVDQQDIRNSYPTRDQILYNGANRTALGQSTMDLKQIPSIGSIPVPIYSYLHPSEITIADKINPISIPANLVLSNEYSSDKYRHYPTYRR